MESYSLVEGNIAMRGVSGKITLMGREVYLTARGIL